MITQDQEDVMGGLTMLGVFMEMPANISASLGIYPDAHLEMRGDKIDEREFGRFKVIVAGDVEVSRWWYTEHYAWRDVGNGSGCKPNFDLPPSPTPEKP